MNAASADAGVPMDATAVRLVLASGSPRRKELLGLLGLPFDVVVPEIDETPQPGEDAITLVRRLATAKAAAVLHDLMAGDDTGPVTDLVVVGADTVVVCDGVILGKPVDPTDAAGMLRRISGRDHLVLSGIAVGRGIRPGIGGDPARPTGDPGRDTGRSGWVTGDAGLDPSLSSRSSLSSLSSLSSEVATTRVRFAEMSDHDVDRYIATGEPADKAGAYAIQGIGGRFVESIEGSFHNVVGLPLATLVPLLRTAGLGL